MMHWSTTGPLHDTEILFHWVGLSVSWHLARYCTRLQHIGYNSEHFWELYSLHRSREHYYVWPLHSCSKIFWPAADSHLADYSLWCMPVQFRHRLLFGNFQTEWTAEIPQSWIRSVEHYRVVFLAVSWLDFQLLGGPLLRLAYFTFTLQSTILKF